MYFNNIGGISELNYNNNNNQKKFGFNSVNISPIFQKNKQNNSQKLNCFKGLDLTSLRDLDIPANFGGNKNYVNFGLQGKKIKIKRKQSEEEIFEYQNEGEDQKEKYEKCMSQEDMNTVK